MGKRDAHPIAAFHTESGYTQTNITLQSSAAIPIHTDSPLGGPKLVQHLTATDCESYVDNNNNKPRIFSNTTCVATTSNEKTIKLQPGSLAALSCRCWLSRTGDLAKSLRLEPYSRYSEGQSARRSSNRTSARDEYFFTLECQRYRHLLNRGDLNAESGLHLLHDVGTVTGTWGLEINGVTVDGVDQFLKKTIHITSYTVKRSNKIDITVTTKEWNKLIEVWSSLYGSEFLQQVGFTGPAEFFYVKDLVVA
ncbi:hypothetical protein N7454_005361 [Penicillium verhagenii]|nr:hypothetical protein N7454_005361 [Penicillium verhagenii]